MDVDIEDLVRTLNENIKEVSDTVEERIGMKNFVLILGSHLQELGSAWNTDKTIPLEMKSSDTIGDVKCKIKDMIGILSDQQDLLFSKKKLKDGCTVSAYNNLKGSTLQLFHPSDLCEERDARY